MQKNLLLDFPYGKKEDENEANSDKKQMESPSKGSKFFNSSPSSPIKNSTSTPLKYTPGGPSSTLPSSPLSKFSSLKKTTSNDSGVPSSQESNGSSQTSKVEVSSPPKERSPLLTSSQESSSQKTRSASQRSQSKEVNYIDDLDEEIVDDDFVATPKPKTKAPIKATKKSSPPVKASKKSAVLPSKKEPANKKGSSKKRKGIESDEDDFEATGVNSEDEDDNFSEVESEDEGDYEEKSSKGKGTQGGSSASASKKSEVRKDPKEIRSTTSLASEWEVTKREGKKRSREAKFQQENEERYTWLVDVKDAQMRKPTDPDYDPKTLYIPPEEFIAMKPYVQQFWAIKKNNFDMILFYKKGRFYELYEGDADIAHEKLDLKVSNRVNMRMAGVPESHYIPYSSKLVSMGYKVGRVDQLETAIGKEKRQKTGGAKKATDDIIRRELTKIYTAGTLVDEGLINSSSAAWLLVLKTGNERRENGKEIKVTVGICLVDTATGEFNLGQFEDDSTFTKLETLLVQTKPKEVLFEKSLLHQNAQNLIKRTLFNSLINCPKERFPSESQTIEMLYDSKYFGELSAGSHSSFTSDNPKKKNWPELLQKYVEKTKPFMMQCLGSCLKYLLELKLDVELVSLKNFRAFSPIESNTLVLDGQTLKNLEILENSRDGGDEGTLLKLLDQCITAPGKRLFKKWICHPLRSISEIKERTNAIEDFIEYPDIYENLSEQMKSLPDLERMISRVHAQTARLSDFIQVLESFEHIVDITKNYLQPNKDKFKSRLLKGICDLGGLLPDICEILSDLSKRFDRNTAKNTGNIELKKGIEKDYDDVMQSIDDTEKQLDVYLKKQRNHFKDNKICYREISKNPYQLELSSSIEDIPSDFQVMSQTKSVNRYYSPEIKKWVKSLDMDKDTLASIRRDLLSRLCVRFDQNYGKWLEVVNQFSMLDCLMSLKMTKNDANACCRPHFVEEESPKLVIEELIHPCIVPK
eukprot:TRINITY_DN1172_c0_g1_i3.p1 TRINITY_DN1172_c0_g1~~TRINITY_DN1172_c0_g1_i3.p1  ORF type:complete len:979 (-),score=309.18 TRINITY_DN1172_c0_g1_i3:1348-4284(-)